MKLKEYIIWLDASILASFKELVNVTSNFLIVIIAIPLHMAYLIFRVTFPFFNPLLDKFKLTDDDE
jgi:hypothetical protein